MCLEADTKVVADGIAERESSSKQLNLNNALLLDLKKMYGLL